MPLKRVCDTTLFSLLLSAASWNGAAEHPLRARAWFVLVGAGTRGFAWNISSCLLFKSLGLSPLQRCFTLKLGLINNVYVQGGHTHLMWRWRKVAKSHYAADQWLERFLFKVLFCQVIFFYSFLGPQFLISKMGRVALPYQLQSTGIGSGTADRQGW